MNKKLFSWKALAGVALLAAISFTSCTSDDPIDPTDPNGIKPSNPGSVVGGTYDWAATASDLAKLQELWAKDKAAVAKLLADNKKNTANILIDVTGYELKNDVITLPDFWGTGATNGKVVNITFSGKFKNADFERKAAIAGKSATDKIWPVQIDANTLKGAEVNFTFGEQNFDLVLTTSQARSTLSGAYTIGYMYANADKAKDALEIKSGTVEGLDMTSTGDFKGTFAGVWTLTGTDVIAPNKQAGIKLNSGNTIAGAKDVFVEADAAVNTWYKDGNTLKTYVLGTVKFMKAATLSLTGEDAIENVVGFDASKCFVQTADNDDDLDYIAAMEKVTVKSTTGTSKVVLGADVYTDVVFQSDVEINTKDVAAFDKVTFNALELLFANDNQKVEFASVNFWAAPTLTSTMKVSETAKTETTTYQWIIDNVTTGAGHYSVVNPWAGAPLLDSNKDKEVKKYSYDNVRFNGVNFSPAVATKKSDVDAANEANSSFVVEITRTWAAGTTYIPEGVIIVLDDKCKFNDGNVTTTGAALSSTVSALNVVWGNKLLWDEQCWYTVNYGGVDYIWKKASGGIWGTAARFVLTKPAAAE